PAEPEPLDLTAGDAVAGDDELVLGAETMVPQPAPRAYGDEQSYAAPTPQAPAASADDAAARRRWIAPGSDAAPEATPAPRVKLGGTLFERMS
ncbi:hypothetical protein ACTGYH_12925, partial [Streptococcus suis]